MFVVDEISSVSLVVSDSSLEESTTCGKLGTTSSVVEDGSSLSPGKVVSSESTAKPESVEGSTVDGVTSVGSGEGSIVFMVVVISTFSVDIVSCSIIKATVNWKPYKMIKF